MAHKMAHGNIHRTVLIRLVLAWLTLSLVLGAIAFYLEMEKTDRLMLDMAITEARSFTDHMNQEDIAHLEVLKQKAEDFLKSDFISVRVYDKTQSKILEVVKQEKDEAKLGIKQHIHSLPLGDVPHYHTYWAGRRPFMQLLLPLKVGGNLVGYFEGVHEVDVETAKNIEAGIIHTLVLVVVVVLATSVALYPIIIFLNKSLVQLSTELLKSNVELMEVLCSAIAKRDSDTHLHNHRVTFYAIRLAETLGVPKHDIQCLIAGAFLHDVGKIGISDEILRKPGPFTDEESTVMHTHVAIGVDIISKAAWLQGARDVVEYHHERFDGSGYMKGLKGYTIPLNARIFAIVDVFDALTSKRAYKEAFSFNDARVILRHRLGSLFDPDLLDAFDAIAPKLFSEINNVDDAIVEETLRRLVNKYFLSIEDVPQEVRSARLGEATS